MPIKQKIIKNILAVRNDRFGEFLLNIPAFRALKEAFPDARLIVVIGPYIKELAQNIPFIDEVMEWGQKEHSLLEKINLIGALRKKNIDIAVMLNPSQEFNIISYLSGIPIRVGYNRKWGFLLTHKIRDEKYLCLKHEVEYNLELVSLVGAKTENNTLSVSIDDNIINSLLNDSGIKDDDNLIAIHPFTSDPIKQWPQEYFLSLAERLARELNFKVLIIGGKEQLDKNPDFPKVFNEKLINFTGKTSLMQLAALLKKTKLLVSGDSGPVHLACAVNTPVIALFRNDIPGKGPRRWGPWGNGHIVIEKEKLSDISPDEVFHRAKDILKINQD